MKKIICLTLALIMLLSVFVSCTPDDQVDSQDTDTDEVTSSEVEETTEAVTEAPVPTIEYDLSKFKIVYGESYLADIAEEFKTQIKVATGLELEVVSGDEVKDDGGYEFVIGRSDREISTPCFNFVDFKYSTYKGVYYKDGKAQILGVDRITMRDSIKYFVATSITEGKKTVLLPEAEGAVATKIDLDAADIPAKADASYLRVVTNNILMHRYTDQWGVPATQNRMSELMGAYALYDADIIMFQEVDEPWYRTHKLVNNMKSLGYSYAAKSAAATYSSSIFYKTSRFDMLEMDSVTYDSSMLPCGRLEGRIYTYAVLQEKETGKQIVASSTHFVAGISGVDAQYTELYRQESAKQLVAFSKSITEKYPNAVVIMGGDYNSNLDSESHRIMSEGLLSARDTAEKTVNMNFQTSLPGVEKRPQRGNPPSVIDHIFYSKSGLTAKHYEVVVSRYSYAYSDHVPVIVDFELN